MPIDHLPLAEAGATKQEKPEEMDAQRVYLTHINLFKNWDLIMQNVAKRSALSVNPGLALLLAGLAFIGNVPARAADATVASKVSAAKPSPEFMSYWKSGLAELASYNLITERYGELRKGQGVLVFVYEEINADTRIKVESDKTPSAKQVPVLKLNNVLKFTTGIYDYSVMTSVFAGLAGGPGVSRPFEPRKVSFTSQEWCGNVFHQIIPRKEGLESEIHSYFESEGDAKVNLPYPAASGPVYYEDEMPILVRELDGAFMSEGETRKLNIIPGLWERRKRHVPLAFTTATLTKAGKETVKTGTESHESVKWILADAGITTTYHVESALPHRLLAWENTKGEKGELIASIRKTYWEHNHTQDEPLRKELKLNYGVGAGG